MTIQPLFSGSIPAGHRLAQQDIYFEELELLTTRQDEARNFIPSRSSYKVTLPNTHLVIISCTSSNVLLIGTTKSTMVSRSRSSPARTRGEPSSSSCDANTSSAAPSARMSTWRRMRSCGTLLTALRAARIFAVVASKPWTPDTTDNSSAILQRICCVSRRSLRHGDFIWAT